MSGTFRREVFHQGLISIYGQVRYRTLKNQNPCAKGSVSTCFGWGGYATPDPPLKSAAVAASASQNGPLEPSRLLSQPPGARRVTGHCSGRPLSRLHTQTPVPFKRGYDRGLTTKPDPWKPRQWPTQAMASHKPGPWRLRQQPTWLKSSNLACGGCDSSRLGLRVPTWLAEAATAAPEEERKHP